jgi:hypothetical protein
MNALTRHPIFAAIMGLIVLGVLGEIGYLANRQRTAQAARAALTQKQQERDTMSALSPSATEDNARAIEADVAKAEKVLATLRTSLQGQSEAMQQLHAAPPPSRMDAYFEIATFVERTRALAARAQVTLAPDERFGFATYANEGPSGDLLAPVIQQRRLMQYLVESLLEARPRSLLGVQREAPLTKVQRDARRSVAPPAGGPPPTEEPAAAESASESSGRDFFVPEEKLSVRVPGYVDSEAFRLEFTGQTPALRSFLNTLAALKLPLFVRNVEVTPLGDVDESPAEPPPAGDGASTGTAAPAGPSPIPLVARSLSKFTLVVEFAELVPAPGANPSPAPSP